MRKMRPITIRMSDLARQAIEEAADYEGISVSQFMRESALGRAWFNLARREGGDELAGKASAVFKLAAIVAEEGVTRDDLAAMLTIAEETDADQ